MFSPTGLTILIGDSLMRCVRKGMFRRTLSTMLILGHLCLASGCATLAHRSSVSGNRVRSTSNCSGAGSVCPWLWADAGLLLLGIVPGVVAFIVDFGTGAWQHDYPVDARDTEEVASAHLLFDPVSSQQTQTRTASAAAIGRGQ